MQFKRGPSIFQPYRDLWKLFHKDEVVSECASWIFRVTPYIAFVAPLFVAMLIPVLTSYTLFFGFMGDMLGGGFILSLAGFFACLAAVDAGNPYGPMGASRTRMVSFLVEPVFMIVFFTVSFVAGSTTPYIVPQRWVASPADFFAPSHVLIVLAFLMIIIAETGRFPVDNPAGYFEMAMIDKSKGLEYSGRDAALMKWGSQMKAFVLMCIFLNVLVAPWGLAATTSVGQLLPARHPAGAAERVSARAARVPPARPARGRDIRAVHPDAQRETERLRRVRVHRADRRHHRGDYS